MSELKFIKDVVQYWYTPINDDQLSYNNRPIGSYGRAFIDYLNNNGFSYQITESSLEHVVIKFDHNEDDEKILMLKLAIDSTNINQTLIPYLKQKDKTCQL